MELLKYTYWGGSKKEGVSYLLDALMHNWKELLHVMMVNEGKHQWFRLHRSILKVINIDS
jgi:hypothetical protein